MELKRPIKSCLIEHKTGENSLLKRVFCFAKALKYLNLESIWDNMKA